MKPYGFSLITYSLLFSSVIYDTGVKAQVTPDESTATSISKTSNS